MHSCSKSVNHQVGHAPKSRITRRQERNPELCEEGKALYERVSGERGAGAGERGERGGTERQKGKLLQCVWIRGLPAESELLAYIAGRSGIRISAADDGLIRVAGRICDFGVGWPGITSGVSGRWSMTRRRIPHLLHPKIADTPDDAHMAAGESQKKAPQPRSLLDDVVAVLGEHVLEPVEVRLRRLRQLRAFM